MPAAPVEGKVFVCADVFKQASTASIIRILFIKKIY
jgi:hypothetical protein